MTCSRSHSQDLVQTPKFWLYILQILNPPTWIVSQGILADRSKIPMVVVGRGITRNSSPMNYLFLVNIKMLKMWILCTAQFKWHTYLEDSSLSKERQLAEWADVGFSMKNSGMDSWSELVVPDSWFCPDPSPVAVWYTEATYMNLRSCIPRDYRFK